MVVLPKAEGDSVTQPLEYIYISMAVSRWLATGDMGRFLTSF